MTREEVQDLFKLRFDDANKFVYMLPQDVIDETIKAYNVSATSATATDRRARRPGATSGRPTVRTASRWPTTSATAVTGDLVVTGPMFQQHDISLSKEDPHVRPQRFRIPPPSC